jgi:hypothetical protein
MSGYFLGMLIMTPSLANSQRRNHTSRVLGCCFLSASKKTCHGITEMFIASLHRSVKGSFVVGLEVGLQIAQRIYSRPATFTDRSSLLGRAHGHLLEHCGDQHFHVLLLEVICCSLKGAMGVPSLSRCGLHQKMSINQALNCGRSIPGSAGQHACRARLVLY